jgi:hypothetical protein
MFLEPALAAASWQLPLLAESVITQLAPAPSLTLTAPVGIPLNAGLTITLTPIDWPTTEGLGEAVTRVVVPALVISGPDALVLVLPK